MPERDTDVRVAPRSGIVGAAMTDRVAHPLHDSVEIGRVRPSFQIDPSCNTAHNAFSFLSFYFETRRTKTFDARITVADRV